MASHVAVERIVAAFEITGARDSRTHEREVREEQRRDDYLPDLRTRDERCDLHVPSQNFLSPNDDGPAAYVLLWTCRDVVRPRRVVEDHLTVGLVPDLDADRVGTA